MLMQLNTELTARRSQLHGCRYTSRSHITLHPCTHIRNDCLPYAMSAIRNLARGRIVKSSRNILNQVPFSDRDIELIWVPAHSGNPGNETAQQTARGSVDRAVSTSALGIAKDSLIIFREITRFRFPVYPFPVTRFPLPVYPFPFPHKEPSKEPETTWRILQN